jgi:hypothetical protein
MNGSNLFCRNFTGMPVSRVLGPLEAWRCNCLRPVHQGHQHSVTRGAITLPKKKRPQLRGKLRPQEEMPGGWADTISDMVLQSADPIKFSFRGGHFLTSAMPTRTTIASC